MKWATRRSRYCIAALVINLFILLWLGLKIQDSLIDSNTDETKHIISYQIDPTLTVIFQDFELFENDLAGAPGYIASNFTDINVLVISQRLPYPPVHLQTLPNLKLVTLQNGPSSKLADSRPESFIQSNFVLFLPDGVITDIKFVEKFQNWVKKLKSDLKDGVAIPIARSVLKCHGISFSVQRWTVEVGKHVNTGPCGLVLGDHGLLLQTKHLNLLSNPFLQPTFKSLYIQLSLVNIKVGISQELYLGRHKQLYTDYQSQWQQKHSSSQKLKSLYSKLGIKLVVHQNMKRDWYGCSKDSSRCFDTVYNDMPEFLYEGRWTPPCCLKALRETAKHVFSILDKCKVRYWLEGGSLLGAARNNDIIPWDYDIDIGIYKDDIVRCTHLAKMAQKNFVDEEGFSWEKAIEGDFYRVQYSESNHLHVDIFPFYSNNGIMTKDTWFKTHKQDTEFPEHFLVPLTRIKFAGISASAPNNVREFLEYKFGKGVIESPKYPNSKIVL